MEILNNLSDEKLEKIIINTLTIIGIAIGSWYFFSYGSDENRMKRIIERGEKENILMFGKIGGEKVNKAQRETRERLGTMQP